MIRPHYCMKLFLLTLLATAPALAQNKKAPKAPPQEPPAAPEDAPASPPEQPPASDLTPSYPVPGEATHGWDVVVTVDNRVLYVRVIKQEPGSFVTFLNPDRREETLAWSQVKVVALVPDRRSTTPVPPAAPGPHVAGGATQSSGQVDPQAGTAGFQASRDCANSTDERCREQGTLNVDGKGFRLGMSGERVTRVKTPPNSDIGGSLEVSGLYGTSTSDDIDVSIYGFGVQGGLRMMFGGQFPGPDGGGWSGLGLEFMAGYQGGGGSISAGGTDIDYSQGQLYAAAGAGYQYMKFGSMDPQTLKQSGFGLFLGYRFGGSLSQTTVGDNEADAQTGTTHGPMITISFPQYNAGTAKLQRWTLTVMGMYISDFVFLTAGAGYTW